MENQYPTQLKIFGIVYKIIYVENASEVDVHKRESLWGQIDFWTRTIRILKNNRSVMDVWHTIWHEALHGILSALHLDAGKTDEKEDEEHFVDLLGLGLLNFCIDNKLDFSKFKDVLDVKPKSNRKR
jgi:hypothetical protein